MMRSRQRPRHQRLAGAFLGMLAGLATLGAGSAAAAPRLSWTALSPFDLGHVPSAVSCASEALCVAVDHEGDALTTADPTAASPSWSGLHISASALNAVSCAPEGLCVGVDATGDAFVRPAGSSSWLSRVVDSANSLTGVSCPQAGLCVAVDAAGRVLATTSPASGPWPGASVDAEHPALKGVSCASPALCVAVDASGDVLTSSNPTGGSSAWLLHKITSEELVGVSCSPAGVCVAVDAGGDTFATANAAGGSWFSTAIDAERFDAVSCASSGLCVAVDARGEALASDEPAAAVPAWAATRPSSEPLAGVSCLPGGGCLAVSSGGRSLLARVPAPFTVTLGPTQVAAAGAGAAGTVNPEDATLGSCRFEYGTSAAYGQSVPCALLPTATGGNQSVSAQLEGLSPNTTYHYRVVASSPSGSTQGSDLAFTTALSSSVPVAQPHPSITGTPAIGQRLSCHANTSPSGVAAQLSYAWVLDLIPIPGASGSTYQLRGRDGGHHLQCQVTALDGGGSATAKSAFVTIPMGGVPVSVGETLLGRAHGSGYRVTLPVTCSAQAPEGCRLSLRLTVVETLQGKRVIALGARLPRAARASLRHLTVTLARANTAVPRGAQRSITLTLTDAAKRILSARRHFEAALQVSGTVIGVIEGQLGSQTVALKAPPTSAPKTVRHAGRKAASRARGAGTRAGSAAAQRLLAATPYMGWDTYFAFGGNVTEAKVLRQASELISLGLERHGYRYVWLDVGWWHGTRDADGEISVSPSQWPHGLAWLTRTLHTAGFLVGLYTDAGAHGCGGAGEGSYGHYQQDANTFASWGFDAVKVDFCGGSEEGLDPAAAYTAFHQAIANNSRRRPMLLSICDFLQPEQQGEGLPALVGSAFTSFTFGPAVGNSWRTDTDVGLPGKVTFGGVLRNMDADAANPQAAGPGHWNDPDYLAPGQGMSSAQFRTQLSMWAILAAPLMVSADLTKISQASVSYLENQELLAIDQDPAGIQGTLVSSTGNGEVWVKPLADGSRAVALLNRGTSPMRIATTASSVGLSGASGYTWRDVSSQHNLASGTAVSVTVPGDGTVLLRIAGR
jgi:Alpha galactosidase A/Alpha galactosidase C-terminal beta sandwich domain